MPEPDAVDYTATKRTAERLARAVDFVNELATGDTIASQTVTAVDSTGADVSGNLIQSVGRSGTQVNWTWAAWGTVGAYYFTRVAATTANGEVHVKVLRLTISGL